MMPVFTSAIKVKTLWQPPAAERGHRAGCWRI